MSEVQKARLGTVPKGQGYMMVDAGNQGLPAVANAYHFFHPLFSCSPQGVATPPPLPTAVASLPPRGIHLSFSKNFQSGSSTSRFRRTWRCSKIFKISIVKCCKNVSKMSLALSVFLFSMTVSPFGEREISALQDVKILFQNVPRPQEY